MALILHPETGFPVADPEATPFPEGKKARSESMKAAAGKLILSVSGWRTVFAASGDEDSVEPDISAEHAVIAGLMADSFALWLSKRIADRKPRILVGIDSRPTGPAIADVMIRVFIARGIDVRYSFIVAAPEIMAHAKKSGELPCDHEDRADGFCYVSASHNPPGHNGVKFGLVSGGVLDAPLASELTESLKARLLLPESPAEIAALVALADKRTVAAVYSGVTLAKRKAKSSYALFTREVAAGSEDLSTQERYFEEIERAVRKWPLGIVAEQNGSARSLSIDTDFLESLGCTVKTANSFPRQFAHRIVPEGESLDQCRLILEAAHAEDPSFVFGYVPDCDGDRGNIVAWDEATLGARVLEAQEVFALSVLAELSDLARGGTFDYDRDNNARSRVAVVVNGPTSMRINEIAAAFDAEVVRAEVGEANVVKRAAETRAEGAVVRIFGEGSNGGNITHPSAVRDPLQTLFAVVKLLALRDTETSEGLFHIWQRLNEAETSYRNDFTLSDIVASLPRYATTSVFEPRAGLTIKTRDHGELKEHFQAVFEESWKGRRAELKTRFGVVSWEAVSCNGTRETRNLELFRESGKGGLKILFKDSCGVPVSFIWMRGSGTEPVFRVLADVRGGDPLSEAWYLDWLKEMLVAADAPS